jgi:hypothetical protein
MLNSVHVEEPIQTSGNKQHPAIYINLPPPANRTSLKPFIDTNSLPKDAFFQYALNIYNEILPHYQDSAIHQDSFLSVKVVLQKRKAIRKKVMKHPIRNIASAESLFLQSAHLM